MTDVELAIAAALTGAEVLRRRFGGSLATIDKGRGDFATNADIESESAILDLLKRERPSDAILAEECGRSGQVGARQWLVDPLCGTLNYAARTHMAAVNVALRDDGRAIAAAVADPFNEEVYWTDGTSAWVRAKGADARLAPSRQTTLIDLNFDPPFPNAPRFRATALAADPEFAASFRPRVVSTSIALTWVATGQRRGYVTDGDMRDNVHMAAALALCEAAGCVMTDLFGGRPGLGATGLITAADAATHTELLRIANRQLQ